MNKEIKGEFQQRSQKWSYVSSSFIFTSNYLVLILVLLRINRGGQGCGWQDAWVWEGLLLSISGINLSADKDNNQIFRRFI